MSTLTTTKAQTSSSTDLAVSIRGVGRSFGAKRALDNVTLEVKRGEVFGLVGENGAGKTTLIKHMLGLLRAKEGEARVFGIDPVADPAGALVKIGYLSEDRDLPGWMRVDELMRYTRAFYPNWDQALAEELLGKFELDRHAKIKNLSRGETARGGLLVALAHRPALLLLDEPSSGLDPIVRRDILGAIVRTVADEGRTVIFSSHLLDEVERVADRVAMLHNGKLVACDTLDNLKANHTRVMVHLAKPRNEFPEISGLLHAEGEGASWTLLIQGEQSEIESNLRASDITIDDWTIPSLEEIFIALNRK